jgi:hypothetical protein
LKHSFSWFVKWCADYARLRVAAKRLFSQWRAEGASGRRWLASGEEGLLLHVQPQLGRMFTEEDDRYGAPRTVIVSHGFWQQRFGGEPDVIGQTLRISNESHTVIGVLPPGFEYFQKADVFVPLGLELAPDSAFADAATAPLTFTPSRV